MSHSSKGQSVHMALELDQYVSYQYDRWMCDPGLFTNEEKQACTVLVLRKSQSLNWQQIPLKYGRDALDSAQQHGIEESKWKSCKEVSKSSGVDG